MRRHCVAYRLYIQAKSRLFKGVFSLYRNPTISKKEVLKIKRRQKSDSKRNKNATCRGHIFEIHGNKLKPDPSEIASQAAKIFKPHCAFFFCVGKHPLNRFLAQILKFSQRRRVSVILNKFKIINPNVLFNDFYAVPDFGTFGF